MLDQLSALVYVQNSGLSLFCVYLSQQSHRDPKRIGGKVGVQVCHAIKTSFPVVFLFS